MSNFPDGKTYMGIAYNKTTATESSTYADYTWSLIKGAQGDQGIQGPTGPQGNPTYTWIKYADTDTGSGMSDSPTGKRFLGLAHNKTTATESNNAVDYHWSPLYDNVVVGGRNLIHRDLLSVTIETTEDFTLSGWATEFMSNQKVLETLEEGVEYTISYDMELVEKTSIPTLYSYQAGLYLYSAGTANDVVFYTGQLRNLNDKYRVVITFTCPPLTDQRVIFYTNRYTTNGTTPIGLDTVKFTNLKLEKGNIATDWTPAPEDIDSRLTKNETDISTNATNITHKVSQTEYDTKMGTFSGTVSEIKQNADAVKFSFDNQVIDTRNLYLESLAVDGYLGTTGMIISPDLYNMTSDYIPVTPGDPYVFSLKTDNPGVSPWSRCAWYTSSKTFISTFAYQLGEYDYVSKVTAPPTAAYVRLSARHLSNQESRMKFEHGNVHTGWSVAPEELYTGITRIDKEGINVSKSNSDINTQLAHDGLSVREGDTTIANFGESGAVVPSISSNVYNTVDRTGVYTVGTGRTYGSLSDALNKLFGDNNKIHTGWDVNLTLYNNLSENVVLRGLIGTGRLIINLNGYTLNGSIYLDYCHVPVYVIDGTMKRSGATVMMQIQGCKYVQVSGCNIDNAGGWNAIRLSHGGTLHVQNDDFVNCATAIDGDNATTVVMSACRGNVSSYAIKLRNGAKGFVSISAPAGGSITYNNPPEYTITYEGTIARVDSTFSPPPVTNQTFTQVFSTAILDTLVHGTTTVDSYYGSTATQNRWDSSMGWKDGRVRMGNEIYNFFAGGSNITIKYRLRRKNSTHGTSLAVKPAPYNHSASFSTGALRGGWTSWATVSSSLFTSAGATLTFYNGVQGSSGYAIWDAIEVEVTVTKQV
jgi:hypothetical protein